MVLSGNEIHVWIASLDQPSTVVQHLGLTLCADEQTRANRFYFRLDRDHFVAGRGLLRSILSYYLGDDPSRLRFCYGPSGKPALLEEIYGNGRLHFNLSHSHGLALYAVACNRRVGVDLEFIRNIPADEQIAQYFFSAEEQASFFSVPANKRPEAFFRCWTRKEAFLKALGDGLNRPLNQNENSIVSDDSPIILSIRENSHVTSKWSIQNLSLAQQYASAIAVEGESREVVVKYVLQAAGLKLNPPCTYTTL